MMCESSRVSLVGQNTIRDDTLIERDRRSANELAQRSTHQGARREGEAIPPDEGLRVSSTGIHIVVLDVGDVRVCRRVRELLSRDHRIHLQQVRFRESTHLEGRLYLMPSSHHTDRHVARLTESLVDIWDRVGLWR
jgi:7-keto-8-aminopelargonate synthetase-like enzyme